MKIEAITLKNHGTLTRLPELQSPKISHANPAANSRADEFAGQAANPPKKILPHAAKTKPSETAPTEPEKNWTVLCYFAADCNLEEYAVRDLLDMQRVGSTKDMNILTQIDRGETPSIKKYGGKPGATRYYVNRVLSSKIGCEEIENLGQINMSDAKELKDFVAWGMKSYPAQNYLVLMYGHGGGVLGMSTDEGAQKIDPKTLMNLIMGEQKGNSQPEEWALSASGENPDIIKPQEMEKALKAAEAEAGVDKSRVLLGLKSCQMGQTENAYQWKEVAGRLLASQSVIYTDSWRMNEILGKPEAGRYNQEQMAEYIFNLNQSDLVDQYGNVIKSRITTGALVDLSQTPNLKPAVLKLEKAIQNSPEETAKIKEILEIKSRPGFFTNTWVVHYASDFYEAARLLAEDPEIQDPGLKKAAQGVLSALDKVIVKSTRRPDLEYDKNSNGLGLTTLSDPKTYEKAGYGDLAFDRDTGWSEFMSNYSSEVGMEEMNQRLPDAQVNIPQLQRMANTAQSYLDNFEPVRLQTDKAKAEIKRIKADPDLTPLDQNRQCMMQVFGVDAFRNMNMINYSITPRNREIMNGVITTALLAGVSASPALETITKTLLLTASTLEGKINTQTLANAAQKMQNEVAASDRRLSPQARQLVSEYHQEKNREKKGELLKRLEAQGPDALNVAVMPEKGAEFLTILGYATRNEKIVNLKNFKGEAPREFLAALSGLKAEQPQPEPARA